MCLVDEQSLLLRAKQGDQAAFGGLMERYEKLVYHQALRLLGNPEDAADVTQEAFFKAWRGLPSFQGESAFSTWLYRLTGNAAIDLMRRERKRRGDLSLDDTQGDWDRRLADPAPLPERRLEGQELRQAVAGALALLSLEHRQILVLREINGASYEQIGQVLGLPAGTVKSRVARARLALAKLLRSQGISGAG